jgi:hypothetical protein
MEKIFVRNMMFLLCSSMSFWARREATLSYQLGLMATRENKELPFVAGPLCVGSPAWTTWVVPMLDPPSALTLAVVQGTSLRKSTECYLTGRSKLPFVNWRLPPWSQ